MKNAVFQNKIFLRLFSGLLLWLVILMGLTLAANQRASQALKSHYIGLMQYLDRYKTVLENAEWAAIRYDYSRMDGQATEEEKRQIKSQMIHLGFALDYGNFLIRSSESGKVLLEVHRNGKPAMEHGIQIEGEKDFQTSEEKIFFRPCQIEKESFLCLVLARMMREEMKDLGKTYAVLTLSVQDAMGSSLIPFIESSFVPLPFLELSLGKQDYPIFGNQGEIILGVQEMILDEGFLLRSGIRPRSVLSYSLWYWLFLFPVLFILFLILREGFRIKVNQKIESTLVESRLAHLDQMKHLVQSVIHDIRSPLGALKALMASQKDGESQVLLSQLIRRMSLIIQDLQERLHHNQSGDQMASLPLEKVLKLVLDEKMKEHRNQVQFEVAFYAHHLWVKGSYSGLMRMFSNLLNNAVEASKKGGRIQVEISRNAREAWVTIRDFGRGIPNDVLPHIFKNGFTLNKPGGHGLGLFQTKETLDEMNARFEIDSEEGEGTTFRLFFPLIEVPSWALRELDLTQIDQVYIVDEDPVVYDLWRERLRNISQIKLHYCAHPNELESEDIPSKHSLILIDNAFGSEVGLGLQFLEKHQHLQCIMITSDWQVKDVQRWVEQLDKKLCGKGFIHQLEIAS